MATAHVLLMRHVAGAKLNHSGRDDEAPSLDYPALLKTGERAACTVALKLRETLEEQPPSEEPISVAAVWHSPRPEPAATAKILATHVPMPALRSQVLLDPATFCPGGGPDAARALATTMGFIEQWAARGPTAAVLIVGHEPQMGWLAHRMTGQPVPIDRGELVCLAPAPGRSNRWKVAWTIHPDDREAVSDIRDKIKSKMDAAKVMGAFITALVTFVLTQFLAQTKSVDGATVYLRGATVVLLLAAAVLFFLSLFHYDSLLMPIRFWGSAAPRAGRWRASREPPPVVRRPPSSSAWVLYQNMVRIWNRTFVPAVCLVGAALITFCQAAIRPGELRDWWVLLAGAGGALLVLGWRWVSRPRLGAQD